jgi:hypothetical protein
VAYFGIAMQQVDDAHGLARAAAAGVGVTRVSELNWDYVEPVRTEPPTYLWDKVSGLEQELTNAAQAGIQVTLLVMYTPQWARKVTSHACSAIRVDALDEFAQFLQAAVERYCQPPFNVHEWELYNEPDVDPSLVPAHSGIGCWGDANDPFYGGRAFGAMLMTAYPSIKAADPSARVTVGGLLLDRPDISASTFLAGVLEAGAGNSFDFLGFHAYTYFFSASVPESDRLSDMPWSSRGGVVAGKAQFLRDVMGQHGVAKPLLLNEAGLGWLGSKPPPAEFPAYQADYVTKLYTRGRALDLVSVIWYGWEAPGWRHMALLNPDLSPRPGMVALDVAIEQIGRAEYLGETTYEGIEGYAFLRGSDRLQVVWPDDAQPHTVVVPLRVLREALDSVGEPADCSKESGQAVFTVERPIYLVLAP